MEPTSDVREPKIAALSFNAGAVDKDRLSKSLPLLWNQFNVVPG